MSETPLSLPDAPIVLGGPPSRSLTSAVGDDLAEALQSVTSALAFHPGDHGKYHRDAWIYGIAAGWDCETDHGHNEDCFSAMAEVAARHEWDEETVVRLRRLRLAYSERERPS